jgi:ribonuclease-3
VTHPLEQTLCHTFRNPTLLQQALCHKSADPHAAVSIFERLEFLGDRVLGLVISQWLYTTYPQEAERFLALRFSQLTDRPALVRVASSIGLLSYMRRARSDKTDTSGERKMISDGMEALLGALFLDGGLVVARSRIKRLWRPLLEYTTQSTPQKDAKSALQEWAQATYKVLPQYKIVEKKGAEHAPQITVSVTIPVAKAFHSPRPELKATASSRKEAEQKVARSFLKKYTS